MMTGLQGPGSQRVRRRQRGELRATPPWDSGPRTRARLLDTGRPTLQITDPVPYKWARLESGGIGNPPDQAALPDTSPR